MILVIQCAARKNPEAGYLRGRDERKVMFVADPGIAPIDPNCSYARPDDTSDTGKPWRTILREYNADPGHNPLGLLPAWKLYKNATYELLADHCGPEHFYILSAGWGLIRADFLTPAYDITFSPGAEKHKRRRKKDQYDDFNMLPERNRGGHRFLWRQGLCGTVLRANRRRQRDSASLAQLEKRAESARLRAAAVPHEDQNQLAL